VFYEDELAALHMLATKPDGVRLPRARKQHQVERKPRLGADRMTLLVLNNLVGGPRMPTRRPGLEVRDVSGGVAASSLARAELEHCRSAFSRTMADPGTLTLQSRRTSIAS
jgi:hypothetical protein